MCRGSLDPAIIGYLSHLVPLFPFILIAQQKKYLASFAVGLTQTSNIDQFFSRAGGAGKRNAAEAEPRPSAIQIDVSERAKKPFTPPTKTGAPGSGQSAIPASGLVVDDFESHVPLPIFCPMPFLTYIADPVKQQERSSSSVFGGSQSAPVRIGKGGVREGGGGRMQDVDTCRLMQPRFSCATLISAGEETFSC